MNFFRKAIKKVVINTLLRKNEGISIFEEPWNNMIILDACRYDIFEKVFKEKKLKGKLECKISKASATPSFLTENFNDYYHDIVYITANPFVNKFLDKKVFKIISVWKNEWCNDYNTVLPSAVYESTLRALKRYPDKKKVIHFLQPHSPYLINKLGEVSIEDQMGLGVKVKYKIDEGVIVNWPHASIKPLKIDNLLIGYTENLRLVMKFVEKLINILPGQTVITSDHGEAFGEFIHPLVPLRIYGHPNEIRIPALVEIPWLTIDQKEKSRLSLERELMKIKINKLKK